MPNVEEISENNSSVEKFIRFDHMRQMLMKKSKVIHL